MIQPVEDYHRRLPVEKKGAWTASGLGWVVFLNFFKSCFGPEHFSGAFSRANVGHGGMCQPRVVCSGRASSWGQPPAAGKNRGGLPILMVSEAITKKCRDIVREHSELKSID